MSPEEIPKELVDILDERAGKKHSRNGPVLACLAEILTEHRKIVHKEILTSNNRWVWRDRDG